jgi:hypothetical protein
MRFILLTSWWWRFSAETCRRKINNCIDEHLQFCCILLVPYTTIHNVSLITDDSEIPLCLYKGESVKCCIIMPALKYDVCLIFCISQGIVVQRVWNVSCYTVCLVAILFENMRNGENVKHFPLDWEAKLILFSDKAWLK